MTTKNALWNQVIENLESKLPRTEIKTWFSQTTCDKLDNNIAIIDVPNKFVANWLRDNYLKDINSSFKKVLKEIPEIHFNYIQKKPASSPQKSQKKDTKPLNINNNLNKTMTFDSFIAGACNRFAFSSAMEVSNRPGNHYNPFYIFSNLSIGKTHLLNAIGNSVINKDPYMNIGYVYSKTFISDFNNSLRNKNFNLFRKKYHNLDILLFDDIQYLANRNKLQEEFLSIFNNLYEDKKQIVITGDNPPSMLKKISPQLKSRLGWGLLTEIKEVDSRTKINIVKNKLKNSNINIPNDIISLLLKSNNDIKILLKNIIRIETYISLNNNINISLIKSLIKNKNTNISTKDIKLITSKYFNISISDLLSNKKKSIYSYPRHLAMYLTRKYTNLSFKEIGYLFGDRDHSTVIYAINKIDKTKARKKEIKKDLNNIEQLLT